MQQYIFKLTDFETECLLRITALDLNVEKLLCISSLSQPYVLFSSALRTVTLFSTVQHKIDGARLEFHAIPVYIAGIVLFFPLPWLNLTFSIFVCISW
jgi:hypothetical protein